MRTLRAVAGEKIDPRKLERAREFRHYLTPEENALWQALRRSSLHGLHFRRQQLVSGFIVDFYCHAAKLAVEVDGPVHRDRSANDAARDTALSEVGIGTLRIANEDVTGNLDGVLERIAKEATKAVLTPGPFPSGKGSRTPKGQWR